MLLTQDLSYRFIQIDTFGCNSFSHLHHSPRFDSLIVIYSNIDGYVYSLQFLFFAGVLYEITCCYKLFCTYLLVFMYQELVFSFHS